MLANHSAPSRKDPPDEQHPGPGLAEALDQTVTQLGEGVAAGTEAHQARRDQGHGGQKDDQVAGVAAGTGNEDAQDERRSEDRAQVSHQDEQPDVGDDPGEDEGLEDADADDAPPEHRGGGRGVHRKRGTDAHDTQNDGGQGDGPGRHVG